MSRVRAVVTAGGTSEPIDDARVVTNFSTGRFGAALARALIQRGVDVTLLASRALAAHADWIDPRAQVVPFGSAAELRDALHNALSTPPDLVFMAAAVSDYAPVPFEGKIRSDADELVVRMTRNPKLLPTLRAACPNAVLCGFKLLSRVSSTELVDVARRQIDANNLDLCLANDLAELGALHPAWIVDRSGAVRVDGDKDHTAAALADAALVKLGRPLPPPDPRAVLRFDLPDDDALIDAIADAADGRLVLSQRARPWLDRGWRQLPSGLLEGPSQRSDLLPAASVGLWHAASRQVLLGRRLLGPKPGLWAFAGGGVEPGETDEAAGRRELHEETGLLAPEGPPLLRMIVHVGAPPRAWRIVHRTYAVPVIAPPTPTAELEPRWFPIDVALRWPEVAPGTRRVLRALDTLGGGGE